MNDEILKKRFEKMQKLAYEKIKKSKNPRKMIEKIINKNIKWLVFSNLRFTIIFNCLKKLESKKISSFSKKQIKDICNICLFLDEILKILTETFFSNEDINEDYSS